MAVIGMLLAAAAFVVPARAAETDASSLLRAGKFQQLDDYYSTVQRQSTPAIFRAMIFATTDTN